MVLLEFLKDHGKIAIFTHSLADLDAAASAAALSITAARLGSSAFVVTPGGATRAARELLSHLSVKPLEDFGSLPKVDAAVLVDANSPARAGDLEEYLRSHGIPLLIVDHHPAADVQGALRLVDEGASSTSEIIARELIRESTLDPLAACALSIGILADTRGLGAATCGTLELYSRLCETCGEDRLDKLRVATRTPVDSSEVLARFRGLQRTRLVIIGGWLVAISTSGSHQSSVAQALVQVGADLGLAIGRGEGEKGLGAEGSMKARSTFVEATGIHLGKLAEELAEELGGTGGGHPTVASFRVGKGSGTATDALLRLLSKSLNSNIRDVV